MHTEIEQLHGVRMFFHVGDLVYFGQTAFADWHKYATVILPMLAHRYMLGSS